MPGLARRPRVQGRVSPARVQGRLFNQLWAVSRLAVLFEPYRKAQYDHVSGGHSTVVGNTTHTFDPWLGACGLFDGTGDRLTWPAHTIPANTDTTFACVVRQDVAAINDSFITTRAASNVGLNFGVDSGVGNQLRLTKGGVVSTDSGLTISTGVPYFLAVSYKHSTGAHRFVTRRLDTGVFAFGNATQSSSYSAGDGTICVGGDGQFSTDMACAMAMAYVGQGFFDTSELERWSLDPFGIFRERPRRRAYAAPLIVQIEPQMTARRGARTQLRM